MIMDVIALQYLYGESNSDGGNTEYDLTRFSGKYYNTLWDAAGNDTLDASKLPYGVYVEMGISEASNGIRDHQIGYITTALDQLSLSVFGFNPSRWTWLWGEYENFIGSSYRDVITGNSLDNLINGEMETITYSVARVTIPLIGILIRAAAPTPSKAG